MVTKTLKQLKIILLNMDLTNLERYVMYYYRHPIHKDNEMLAGYANALGFKNSNEFWKDFTNRGLLRIPIGIETLFKYKIGELKTILRLLNLKVSGRKNELLERINSNTDIAQFKPNNNHEYRIATDMGNAIGSAWKTEYDNAYKNTIGQVKQLIWKKKYYDALELYEKFNFKYAHAPSSYITDTIINFSIDQSIGVKSTVVDFAPYWYDHNKFDPIKRAKDYWNDLQTDIKFLESKIPLDNWSIQESIENIQYWILHRITPFKLSTTEILAIRTINDFLHKSHI